MAQGPQNQSLGRGLSRSFSRGAAKSEHGYGSKRKPFGTTGLVYFSFTNRVFWAPCFDPSRSISASGRVWSCVEPDRTFSSSMAMFTSGSSSEPGLSIHDSQIFQKGRAWTTASCEVLDGICKELERWNEWLHPSREAENFWFLLVGRMPVHLLILVIFSGTLIFSLLVGSDPGKGAVWSLLELN